MLPTRHGRGRHFVFRVFLGPSIFDHWVDLRLSAEKGASIYTKTEADNLSNATATASTVDTKTEADNLFNAKATTTIVYTETEADNLVNQEASTTALSVKQDALNNGAGYVANLVYMYNGWLRALML
jgi:hypothetical protein